MKTLPQNQGKFFPKRSSLPIGIQPKLTINPAPDPYEKQADAMADKVMRMSDQVEADQK